MTTVHALSLMIAAGLAGAPWNARAGGFSAPRRYSEQFGADDGWRVNYDPRAIADVDGDGRKDLVGFRDEGVQVALMTTEGFAPATRWSADFGTNAGWEFPQHLRMVGNTTAWERAAGIVAFGDDGVYVARSTGSSFAAKTRWSADFAANSGWRRDRHLRLLAWLDPGEESWSLPDIELEDNLDIVGFGDDGVYVARGDGTRFAPAVRAVVGFGYNEEAGSWRVKTHPRMLADLDGDRAVDIVGFGADGVYVSMSRDGGFSAPQRWSSDFGADTWDPDDLRTSADVNNDMMSDIIGFAPDGVYVSLSTGEGLLPPERWLDGFGADDGWSGPERPRFVASYTVYEVPAIIGFGEDGVYVSLSTGEGFTAPQLWVEGFGADQKWNSQEHLRRLVDLDGDYNLDIVGFHDDGVYVSFWQL